MEESILESDVLDLSITKVKKKTNSIPTVSELPLQLVPLSTHQKISEPKLRQRWVYVWESRSWFGRGGRAIKDQLLEKSMLLNIYLIPLSFLYFWKFVVVEVVVWIHVDHLTLCWSSKHFNYLNKVINAILSNEKRGSLDHLQKNAANRPDIDHGGVMSCSKD